MAVAEQAAPAFEGMPGLCSKVFTFDPESGDATNVYVWESEAAARERARRQRRRRAGLTERDQPASFASSSAMSHAPSDALETTVRVVPVPGSCELWNETPAS